MEDGGIEQHSPVGARPWSDDPVAGGAEVEEEVDVAVLSLVDWLTVEGVVQGVVVTVVQWLEFGTDVQTGTVCNDTDTEHR